MPTISNATVATGTGLSTAGNGGRKLVRLANGTLVSVVTDGAYYRFYKSTDDGTNWSSIGSVTNNLGSSSERTISIVPNGNIVHVVCSLYVAVGSIRKYVHLKVTPSSNTIEQLSDVDTSQSICGLSSLAINDAGTELHAAWSSKNATYPNSFNIRYAKGTINGDGSVTWGAVVQVTANNTVGWDFKNPTIVVRNDNKAVIMADALLNSIYYVKSVLSDGTGMKDVYIGNSYAQSNPSSLFVPQSINGLASGRLWVAWHGKDATDGAKFNVRVSYSDDGGVTWATPTKLTTGNLYDRQNVSLAADKTGKVFALYEEHQWSPDLDIYMRTYNGSWGAPVAVAEADPAAESNPSALVDYSLQMTTPPFVFMSGTDGIKFSGNFNVGAAVSPVSGSLGSKETPTITAYTVTPENGSTVTQIVEKLNGVTLNTYNNPASLSRTFTIPQVNWDGISFWQSQTAEIIVTDSNGATTTTTYTFVKALADNAPLLEGVAATEDAYERISDKRDALAAQVGLSAGSTFDEIMAQLASGLAFKKFQTGQVASVNGSAFTVSGLSFKPMYFIAWTTVDTSRGMSVGMRTPAIGIWKYSAIFGTQTPTFYEDGFSVKIDSASGGHDGYTWIAFG